MLSGLQVIQSGSNSMPASQRQEQSTGPCGKAIAPVFGNDAVADMTVIGYQVKRVTDAQIDMPRHPVIPRPPHLETVCRDKATVGLARKLFDQNKFQVAVDQLSGIVEDKHAVERWESAVNQYATSESLPCRWPVAHPDHVQAFEADASPETNMIP